MNHPFDTPMQDCVTKKVSNLGVGDVVGPGDGQAPWYVCLTPSSWHDDGKVVRVRVKYVDGGESTREWQSGEITVQVATPDPIQDGGWRR